jgi:hypothetical protein
MFPNSYQQQAQKGLLVYHARSLGQQLVELTRQVREAVATTGSETMARLARDAIQRIMGPRWSAPAAATHQPTPAYDSDPWAEDPDQQEWSDSTEPRSEEVRTTEPSTQTAGLIRSVILAAGLSAASWWLRRSGSVLRAVGMALITGVFAVFGDAVAADGIHAVLQHL